MTTIEKSFFSLRILAFRSFSIKLEAITWLAKYRSLHIVKQSDFYRIFEREFNKKSFTGGEAG